MSIVFVRIIYRRCLAPWRRNVTPGSNVDQDSHASLKQGKLIENPNVFQWQGKLLEFGNFCQNP